uniref:Uncharacterized protein n=1 Tax=Ditylenchus dipsaci TaxID=166011 RepID=A0A915DPH8_9BILA
MEALKSELTGVITENYETVIAIVQSIWGVLVMNLTLLSTIVIAILSLVLNFGFDILNFLIEIIVFLTAVYYLLASSDEQWVPLKVVNDFTSSFQFSNPSNGNNGSSAEHPQRPVLVKLWKALLVESSIFAAIPIVPPYVVGILGFFELFLVRGETVAGAVFALASLAPLFFADAAFYREIKGSHPYVTGLSVVGGIYWLGLQGAIIGPIILVCMIVLANLYNLTRAKFVGAARASGSVD